MEARARRAVKRVFARAKFRAELSRESARGSARVAAIAVCYWPCEGSPMPGMPPSHEAGRLQGIVESWADLVVQPAAMAMKPSARSAKIIFFMMR